ncbi:MAG: hypothetical protein JXP34_14400 [Planctomycetes bacterium]|nr:hypothetical protein [Planctomycetota bacterium]
MPGTIRTVGYALNGFAIGYTSGDHHVWKSEVDIQPMSACGNTAVFDVNFLLRDKSGNIDDRYGGWVDVLVIADLV